MVLNTPFWALKEFIKPAQNSIHHNPYQTFLHTYIFVKQKSMFWISTASHCLFTSHTCQKAVETEQKQKRNVNGSCSVSKIYNCLMISSHTWYEKIIYTACSIVKKKMRKSLLAMTIRVSTSHMFIECL